MLYTKYQGTRHCCFRQEDFVCFPNIKVKQRAKTRNGYNQVPQPTRDTIWESDKIQKKHHTQEPGDQPFPSR